MGHQHTPLPAAPVASGRQPFEVALLACSAASGAAGLLIPGGGSRTIAELLPGYAVLFHVLLLGGAVIAGAGVMLGMPASLLVERVGMLLLGSCFLAYGTGVFLIAPAAGATGGIVITGFGLAAAARAAQITRDLSRLMATLRAAHE